MDLNICSLNVRGLGDYKDTKCLTGLEGKVILFTCFKKCTAQKTKSLYGLPNGDIKHFLVAVPVLKEESRFFSIITLIFKSYGHTWIPTADLSSAILQQIKNA